MKLKFLAVLLIATVGIAVNSNTTMAWQDTAEKKQDDDKGSIQERMQDAIGFLQDGEFDEGIKAIEKVLEDHPDNINVMMTLMNACQQRGMQLAQEERTSGNELFYKSAKVARMVKEKLDGKEIPEQVSSMMATSIYNEACTFAIDKKNEKALASLKESFEYGFENLELAETDADFGDMRETEEFKKIIADEKKKREVAKKEAIEKERKKLVDSIKSFESYDFDFELKDVEGKSIAKSDFKGKFLIVDIWGTWCPPCRREIPSFIKLKNKMKGKLDIVGLAYERGVDDDEAIEQVKEFMDDKKMNYRCAIGTKKIKKQVPAFVPIQRRFLLIPMEKSSCNWSDSALMPISKLS